jgi:hypothetical protein
MRGRRPDPTSGSQRALRVFDADPTLTSYEVAAAVGLDDSYVRALLRRRGRKLMRGKGQKKANEQANHA